ncbi:nucleotide exchange factor GrpE [Patescibacteria group bacterium]|nr:nucleotide exchange factor GrpE [Patescibacteria group bacterium]
MTSKEKQTSKTTAKIAKLEQEKEQYLNGWRRTKADYMNREKEIAKEKENWIKFANSELILDLLPILDSFDGLLKDYSNTVKQEKWVKGIKQIKKQLEDFLKKQGITRIKTNGEEFDPLYHEAVGKVGDLGKIDKEVQAGYLVKGKVIRSSKVIIK